MKKLLFLFFFFSVLSSISLSVYGADEEDTQSDRTNTNTMNIRFEPMFLFVGGVSGGFDYKISDHFAVGPEVCIWKLDFGKTDFKLNGLGLGFSYHFNKSFQSGFMVGFRWVDVKLKMTNDIENAEGEAKASLMNPFVGYHWFWNTFNLGLAVGAQTFSQKSFTIKRKNGTDYKLDLPGTTSGSDIRFVMGFAF